MRRRVNSDMQNKRLDAPPSNGGATKPVSAAVSSQPAQGRTSSTRLKPLRVMKFGGTSVGDASCIAKVVETLQHIEERVSRFADVMNAKDIEGFLTEQERERAERKEKFLLHGPQLAGGGAQVTF